ncbi:MAG: flippase activity-associated protein Agl23 [Pyrinomonadaceae bacterium]
MEAKAPTPERPQPETVALPQQTSTPALKPPLVPTPAPDMTKRAWLIASFVILVLAIALRFSALELKPMHHDEGINGFFLTNLLRQGVYKYDPTNYHGPTLYYLTLPAVALFGLSTFAVRFMTALFGVGIVWLALSLRRCVGAFGALAAAALIAVSPSAIFYSRYFIHETMFVFFTLGLVVAALRFYETRATTYLMLAAASAGLLFATKETAFISVGTLVLAWLVARSRATSAAAATKASPKRASTKRSAGEEEEEAASSSPLPWFFDTSQPATQLGVWALARFLFINILFYSSFFTHWAGTVAALDSLKIWTKTGTSEFHGKPFGTYLTWLIQQEAPILALAVVGSVVALFERRANRFAVFAGAWAFGMFAAYSLIPYKTPWLVLNFAVPMAIIGGYAVQVLGERSVAGPKGRARSLLVAGLAVAVCMYQSAVLNFREYDNDQYPYVYTQTQRETHALVNEVERLAERAGTKQIGVTITSSEHWPLPWYFRNNPRVGYTGSVSSSYNSQDVPIVIGRESADSKEDQSAQLRAALGAEYKQVGVYRLRPGVRLALFARRDLANR